MEFITRKEAEGFFFDEVYKGDERDKLFYKAFKEWLYTNDIVITEEMEEGDFSGSTNEDR